MNIITKHTATKNGAGRVVATGGGKQKTVTWEAEDSEDRNHGNAAGELLKVLVRPERRDFIKATARHTVREDGKHVFTVSI